MIRGQEARALIESHETGEGHMFSYDTEKMDKVKIYHEQITIPKVRPPANLAKVMQRKMKGKWK